MSNLPFAPALREHLGVPPAGQRQLRLAIIGGGSAYTPGLVEGLLRLEARLPVERLALMDVDEGKLQTVGGLVGRRLRASGHHLELVLTTCRRQALEGADFVLCQIRVGGLAGRSLDEKIAIRHRVIGQETTGPGGFAMGLRTIPVMLEVAADTTRYAPGAWIVNYSNPTGLVASALHRSGYERVLSLCDIPMAMQQGLAMLLGVPRREIFLDYAGLNHLACATRVICRGKDLLPALVDLARSVVASGMRLPLALADQREEKEFGHILQLMATTGLYCSPYLHYYLHGAEVLNEMLSSPTTRADEVMALEKELLEAFAGSKTGGDLSRHRGYDWHADAMMEVVAALANHEGGLYVVNVPNRGNLPSVSATHMVEVNAVVDRAGAHPLQAPVLPPLMRGLVSAVAAYEELAVEAALEGSYHKACLALAAHPLVPSANTARRLCDDYLAAHRDFLPQFRP